MSGYDETTSGDRQVSTADLAGAQNARDGEQPDAAASNEAGTSAQRETASDLEPLLDRDESERFRVRWQEIQTGFVDEPEQSVQQADNLVAELMQRLAQTFNEERHSLEEQLRGSSATSTEDLRVGLQRYRSFFQRLLST
jgi:hypothetical protein